jgi:hypothetical protein
MERSCRLATVPCLPGARSKRSWVFLGIPGFRYFTDSWIATIFRFDYDVVGGYRERETPAGSLIFGTLSPPTRPPAR